ncbi:class I SAM-dependent methyltransferase, partial [bacterium AH-315-M05]|nr:class I SAM-dependent methyltransferase [bacterium AH-315-M05]
YQKFIKLLLNQSTKPIVLVVGGGILGEGMEELASHPAIELVESDIFFGSRTKIILDAHNIPFKENSFDAVIVQAVLEHVVDPYQCVDEIHRVLKEVGLVYAETPFMQQVHLGAYDFTRFTSLGHRRLFRKFKEIDRGTMCGPGMALSWAYSYFLLSFSNSWFGWSILYRFGRITSFFLKYIDYYLINKPGAEDAASGVYFMGQKSNEVLSDKELIKQYRGVQ